MAIHVGALIVGVGYLYRAILDIGGERERLEKYGAKYFPASTSIEIREWQKKKGWAELAVCAGAFIIVFCGKVAIFYVLGAAFVACGLLVLLKMERRVLKK